MGEGGGEDGGARLRRRDVKRILAVVVCGRLLFDGLTMVVVTVVTVDSSDCSGGSLGGDSSWVRCLCLEMRTMLELEGSCSQG